jgi:hypothetical protein
MQAAIALWKIWLVFGNNPIYRTIIYLDSIYYISSYQSSSRILLGNKLYRSTYLLVGLSQLFYVYAMFLIWSIDKDLRYFFMVNSSNCGILSSNVVPSLGTGFLN